MTKPTLPALAVCIALPTSIGAFGYWSWNAQGQAGPVATVSQKGRAFSLNALTLKTGDTVRIVNDDADLQHHAYIDSNTFKFDSGDQEPGSHADITFPVSGTFTVQCGIHPKMRMTVTVK